jgi:hypothetical protein
MLTACAILPQPFPHLVPFKRVLIILAYQSPLPSQSDITLGEQLMSSDWTDTGAVFRSALQEGTPPSNNSARSDKFGIKRNTEFSSGAPFDIGTSRTKFSQTNKNNCGPGVSTQSLQRKAQPIVAGASLSTFNKASPHFREQCSPEFSALPLENHSIPRTNRVWAALQPAVPDAARGTLATHAGSIHEDRGVAKAPMSQPQSTYGTGRSKAPPVQGLIPLPVECLPANRGNKVGHNSYSPDFSALVHNEFTLRPRGGGYAQSAESRGIGGNGTRTADRGYVPPEPRRSTRSTPRRPSGPSEVIDLVCSDDDEDPGSLQGVVPPAASSSSPSRAGDVLHRYAQIPGMPALPDRSTYGHTGEPICVERIYVGVHGYEASALSPLYVRVDRGVNECLVLRLPGAGAAVEGTEGGEEGAEAEAVLEEIPFKAIKKIL